jgi:hypothetical protein
MLGLGLSLWTPAILGRAPGVLDSLPAAAAAYSFRRLRTAYAGPAWRVRRASDNAEQDIAPGDTAALLAFCAATNGFRVTAYDQTGNGRHRTQATAANQPQVVTAGALTVTQNGRPGAAFDGVNDSDAAASWGVIPQPFTRSIVATRRNAATGHWINSVAGAPNAANYATTGTNFVLFGGTGGTPVAAWNNAEAAVFTTLFSDAASTTRKNGAVSGPTAIGANGFDGVRVGSIEGASAFFAADDYELIIFAAALSASDAQTLERNQGGYYGISVL